MSQAKGIVDRGVRDIASTVGKLKEIFAGGFVAAGFVTVAKQAMEAEQAVNRLNAVVAATGNTSGFAADQLHDLADAMAEASQFDDEDIRGAIASYLKFGNVHGDVMKRALKVTADFAAFTGTTMAAASETLGKAISSPAQGIERLQRAIGYLNPAQVEAIKNMQEMGDVAGAQSALMTILEQKIGGVAETMNTGYTKAFADAKKATGEFFETVGGLAVVTVPVQTFLKFAADSMRDMKHIIEDGDWVQAAKFLMGFRQTDEQAAARRPKKDIAADPAAQAAAEAEAAKKFQQALADQDAKFIEGALKRNKEAAEKRLKDNIEAAEAMQRAEEMFAADYAEAWKWADHYRNEEAKQAAAERDAMAKAEDDANEMFAKDYAEAWKFANEYVRKEEMKRTEEAEATWGGFIGGIDSAFRQTWDAFGSGAKNAGQVARDALKRILFDWIYQMMLKPFVLNIVASGANALGLSGLGSLATSAAGGGNILGGLGSAVSAAGSFFGGPELLAGAPTFLEGLGPMLSAAGPYVAAIAAAVALYSAFKDSGENWKGKLGFGSSANAYTTTGPFGVQGFEYLAGSDATNRQIQAFMGSTLGLDRQLAGRLTPAQIAAITGNLAGPYGTRADGQPAEFAFGKDDPTAMAQLTKEFLQRKYSVVFEQIDAEFADFIRNFGGTSEELLKAIGEFAGVLDALDATGIKGLNLDTLKAFRKEGEELGATFARLTSQWNAYQEAFLTDGEKIALVQDQVAKVFSDLGIAVPASVEDFKALVNSLDLSTESGRAMFTALMGIAPAFASVANASKALLTTFDQIVGAMRPGYSKGVLEQSLESEVKRFMGGASWTQGLDWRYVAGQLRNIGREDFQNYSPAQQQIITTILSIISQLDALDASAGNASGSVGSLGDSARTAAQAMAGAKDSLWAYLQGLLVNPSLSPLDPMGQLGVARSQFFEQLGLARGGDVGAASGLSGYIDRVLGLGRTVYGSAPGYVDLFNEITGAAGGFARPGSGDLTAGIYAESRVQSGLMREVRNLLLDIRDRPTADGETMALAVENSGAASGRR